MGPQFLPVLKNRYDYKTEPECWGYIDSSGSIAIDYQFEHAGDFRDGMARVVKGGRTTYIDERGTSLLKDNYDKVGNPSEGRGLVQRGERLGYVDRDGALVIDLRYEEARGFSDGLAAVRRENKWGYVDPSGVEKIAPSFDDAKDFCQGLAAVKIGQMWGYVDPPGSLTIDPRFDFGQPFSESLAAVQVNGKWGYVDTGGTLCIEPEFDIAREFHDGLANVGRAQKPWSSFAWHFIDRTGKRGFELEFTDYSGTRFSEGVASIPQGAGSWVYCDKTGVVKIDNAKFTGRDVRVVESRLMTSARPFRGGIAQVMLKPSYNVPRDEFRWDDMAYIDAKGEVIWGNLR